MLCISVTPINFLASSRLCPLSRWCEIGEDVLRDEREGVAYPAAESKESRLPASCDCARARWVNDDEKRLRVLEPSSDMSTLTTLRSSKTSKS